MQEKEEQKMSAKKDKKLKVAEETVEKVTEQLGVAEEAVVVATEVSREDWDRVVTPTTDKDDGVKFDHDRKDMKGSKVDGVRYARINERGVVMQVRVEEGIERHWWTLKDAIDAMVLGAEYEKWTGYFTGYDGAIARVEIMEKLGLPVTDAAAMAYANGVKLRKEAEAKRAARESEIVAGGKTAFVIKAKDAAEKRFDKIEARVNEREAKKA